MKTVNKIELWPITRLKPYIKNARTHSRHQIDDLKKSINEFGFLIPIIVNAEEEIKAGHARFIAATEIGFKEVPVIVVDHLSKAQQKAYVIADNKIAQKAGWDFQILGEEFWALDEMDFDSQLTGFSLPEIEAFTVGPVSGNGETPDTEATGSQELSSEDFSQFNSRCPRCSFEFNQD